MKGVKEIAMLRAIPPMATAVAHTAAPRISSAGNASCSWCWVTPPVSGSWDARPRRGWPWTSAGGGSTWPSPGGRRADRDPGPGMESEP
jgi:hypothetical protein